MRFSGAASPWTSAGPLTDAFGHEAEQFLRRHRSQPFFLCVAYNAVHSPMQASTGQLQRFEAIEDVHRRIFAAMLADLDASVGSLLRTLHELELENTLVVFLSDNGGPTRELTSRNGPLRGEKGSLYEGGIRVPFLMQWTGTLPAGRVEDRPVIALDIEATIAAASGLLPLQSGDGVDLRPYLSGENAADPHETLYWRVGAKRALRQGPWKLHRAAQPKGNPWELYHLVDDVGETQNLADREPERVRTMQQAYDRLDAEMVEPLWR